MSVGSDDDLNMDLDDRCEQTPQENVEGSDRGEEGEWGAEQMEQTVGEQMRRLEQQIHEVNTETFDELCLTPAMQAELKATWSKLMDSAVSRDAAGQALYSALFDAAPSLQPLFTTPRAVMVVRIRQGIANIVHNSADPAQLKKIVEALAFNHLNFEVTVPRIGIFRDAICDLLALELGESFSTVAREAWCVVLNYLGGAFIYVRTTYAERFSILASSWATANQKEVTITDTQDFDANASLAKEEEEEEGGRKKRELNNGSLLWSKTKGAMTSKQEDGAKEANASTESAPENTILGGNATVPKTFHDMFLFNAVVMGFGNETWMADVLDSFDNLVTNMSNANRMQEECDTLSLCIAKHRGTIVLSHFKSVMLATLRSLVPKDWNAAHEAAWSWLWENVERMLRGNMGKPAVMERALGRMLSGLTDDQRQAIRTSIYATLFSRYPAAEDVFKQSTTRLHFIADRVVSMTLEMFREPKKMAEDISALGLRHVGYGVRTDLFAPFVTACVDVVRGVVGDDEDGEEGFRWSLSLISSILVRVISEGSTIVMRAINANSGRQLKEAVNCAPRSQRAMWVLKVQVGTQSISPLHWAIENGALDAVEAILLDLLTIRADRDRYYYGMESMFARHPDIVRKLANDAPKMLPVLLDGLIWRSRTTELGSRRVNYYVKHLVVAHDGSFNQFVEWIADHGDPKMACHPVATLVTDMIWTKVAFRTFLLHKSWYLFTLLVFVVSQAVLHEFMVGRYGHGDHERVPLAVCRAFIYSVCMSQRIYVHVKKAIKDIRAGQVRHLWRVPYPEHLMNWQDIVSLALCCFLILMLCTEPILHCITDPDGTHEAEEAGIFTQDCVGGENVQFKYQIFSMVAMLLYFALLIDLSALSTTIGAFILICGRVLTELWLFLFGMFFWTLAFSAAIAAEANELEDWKNMGRCFISFMEILFRVYDKHHVEYLMEETFAFACVVCYCVIVLITGTNLLVAQLNCAYQATFDDMLGFARLNRCRVLVEVMPAVPGWRWDRFVASLALGQRCEFGTGDVGLPGGMQVLEPAGLHPTAGDRIRRYGGSTAPEAPWPADEGSAQDNDEEKLMRLERALEKIMRKVAAGGGRRGGGGGGSTMNGSVSGSAWSGSAQESGTHSSSSAGSVRGGARDD